MIGQDYFAMLNEVEQEQFVENFQNCRIDNDNIEVYLKDEFDDFDMFISSAFIFDETDEGRDYWIGIRDSQRDGVDTSSRRGGLPKSIKEIIVLSLIDSFIESKDKETTESLEDVLSELKIKLSDDKI